MYRGAFTNGIHLAIIWGGVHLPFIMSYVLGAAALSKLVLASDCSDADMHDLTPFYEEKSEDHLPAGLRWLYCVGLGLALLFMGVISLTHVHKDPPIGVRIKKCYRLANRAVVCVIFFCLPLAHDLNSLQLVSITTGMVVWVLLLELFGVSCPGDSFVGEKRRCKYTARCKISKKDLESAVKSGTVINVENLSGKGEKGMYEMS